MLGLAAFVVVLLLGAALVVDRLRITNRVRLQRVYAAQAQLSDLFGLLRDMETAQRGYLPTGNDLFLEPYNAAVAAYPGAAAELRRVIDSANLPAQIGADVAAMEAGANAWRSETDRIVVERVAAPLSDAALQQALATDKRLFDDLRSRTTTLADGLEAQRRTLSALQDRYYTIAQALFVLIAGTTLAALVYGITLVRRVGFLASALQSRQERQEAYTKVISTLNGSQQLAPLLEHVLPQLADSVGAHAAVVYALHNDQLVPAHAVGFAANALPSIDAAAGLPGRVLHENRALVIGNDPAAAALPIGTGLGVAAPHSVAYVPLRYGAQRLGVLVVAALQPFTAQDTHQLGLVASQLATAIRTVNEFESTQQLAGELAQQNERLADALETSETLQDIGRELVVQSDLQAVLTLVCGEARRLLRADATVVATVCDDAGATRWVAVDGIRSQHWQDYVFAPHEGTAGRAIDQAGPVVLEFGEQNAAHAPDEFPFQGNEAFHSALGVPLFRKETPIGALVIAYRRAHTITPAQTALAQSLASYASIAIENARLLNELGGERDLAEQRARELAAKNKEVERTNRLKSEFLANMSHELRTPLNSVLALSQILLDRLDGELTAEQEKQVQIIERNGRNLLRLINEILDLSKIEAGRVDLDIKPVSVPDLLGAVRSTVAPLAGRKALALHTEIAPDVPICHTDENKLKQVLLNLLSNAVKFTEHGSVTLRACVGRPGAHAADAGAWITFEVEDTGIGIAPDDQAVVWEEFQQIDGSLSRRYEGTGLGLAIVRRLVRLLGGEIMLDSMPGQGSTFRFWLPTTWHDQTTPAIVFTPDRHDDAPAASAPIMITPAKPLVLVVDDDIEVSYILEKYLRDEGYQIAIAQHGDEAIRKARELQPFAITLDVALPGRDGWDVMQTLKSDPATQAIRIIMISMLDNRQWGYQLGAADYLVKPIDRAALLHRLDLLHTRHAVVNTALVVDDDPVQVDVIARTLRDTGVQVHTCGNGADALRWLDEHTPDLITLDLMMPGMDGFAVLEAVRGRPHLHAVPILVITAKDIEREDRERLNGRIAAIIQKGPQQRDELLRELAARLRAHQRQADVAQPA